MDLDDDDLQGFEDYTVASPWEKLVITVEDILRRWTGVPSEKLPSMGLAFPVEGHAGLYVSSQTLSYDGMDYILSYYITLDDQAPAAAANPPAGAVWPRSPTRDSEDEAAESRHSELQVAAGAHSMQRWFGVSHYLVLSPATYSGSFMDIDAATVLLSAVTCACSNGNVALPVLAPVHDPSRCAYLGLGSSPSHAGICHTFEVDKVSGPAASSAIERLSELDILEGLAAHLRAKLGYCVPEYLLHPQRLQISCRFTYTSVDKEVWSPNSVSAAMASSQARALASIPGGGGGMAAGAGASVTRGGDGGGDVGKNKASRAVPREWERHSSGMPPAAGGGGGGAQVYPHAARHAAGAREGWYSQDYGNGSVDITNMSRGYGVYYYSRLHHEVTEYVTSTALGQGVYDH
eukprot:jgi/Mesvir1/21461/Mv03917-RA.1